MPARRLSLSVDRTLPSPPDPTDILRIKSLWTAVLLRALKDANGPRTVVLRSSNRSRRVPNPHRREARRALYDGRLDGVCHLLGMKPEVMREYARKKGWDGEDGMDRGGRADEGNLSVSATTESAAASRTTLST